MASQGQGWSPFWDDCQVLIYCPHLRNHSGVSWSKSPCINKERPPIQSPPLNQVTQNGKAMNFLSPHLPRTILATFHFFKSLQKTHTIIHFNWHLQALVIDHLEKRHKTLDACVGRTKVGDSPPTAAVCPYYWALSHKLLCILYSVLISDSES